MYPIDLEILRKKIVGIDNIEPLKQGGQKLVYSAQHNEYGKVVLKIILQPDERALREIDIAREIEIPNTAALHEWGNFEQDGQTILFIIEQYIAGTNLRDELRRKGSLSLTEVLNLIDALLKTVEVLERNNLVHRDIKPENIMVCPDGKFILLDFGIARHLGKSSLTPSAAHFGPHTAGYAAPEQYRNLKKEIDIRTDLFAIGIVAYESLSGKHPFIEGSRDYLDTIRRTETLIPDRLEVENDKEGKLMDFIAVLMSKFPSRRPPTALHAQKWFESIRSDIEESKGE
jgi:eukaryotic-like serine/threonine-protein kinase